MAERSEARRTWAKTWAWLCCCERVPSNRIDLFLAAAADHDCGRGADQQQCGDNQRCARSEQECIALAADQRSEQGDAEHAAGLPGGVEHARRNARARFLHAAEQRRGHRGHQQSESAAHRDERDTDHPVARALLNAEQGETPRSRYQRADSDGDRRTDPLGDSCREQVHRQYCAHHRHKSQARRKRCPVIDLLEIKTEQEDQTVERDVDEEAYQRGQRKHAMREQRQRQHGLPRAAFLEQEKRAEDCEGAKAGENPGICPAYASAFNDRAR